MMMLHEAAGTSTSLSVSQTPLNGETRLNGADNSAEPAHGTVLAGSDGEPKSATSFASKIERTPAHFLGEVVSLLNESPMHRHLFISDLEWFALPPIRLGQFRTLHARDHLIGIAFWASVSEQVDKELEQGRTRLRPDEWKSGDRLWLIDIIAPSLLKDAEGAAKFLSMLAKEAFAGKPFKMWRMNPKSGRPEVVETEFAANPKEFSGVGVARQP